MARGRMLNKSVCRSKKFHGLPDDTCRLFATWVLSHLDIRGVFHADPTTVRSLVFPRREDVTSDQVRGYLDAMEAEGLIVRFDHGGEAWQYWPGFEHNQIGIRYDRESSEYPPPPSWCPDKLLELVQTNGGQSPAEEKGNEIKKKLKEHALEAPPRHPAIDVYRSKARRFPDKAQWPAIEQAINTDDANLEFWGRVVEAYILCGWNKTNIGAMLDWFKRGELPHTGGTRFNVNGNGKSVAVHATPADVTADFEKLNQKTK